MGSVLASMLLTWTSPPHVLLMCGLSSSLINNFHLPDHFTGMLMLLQGEAEWQKCGRCTDVCTVVEGQTYQPSARRIAFGGADLNVYLAQLLEKRGITVKDPALLEPVKEACIRVSERASLLEEELEQVGPIF
jgi:hypothetical protein